MKKSVIQAYTLIEILVGITIISVLFAIGYVNFRDFSRRQVIAGAGKLLQGDLRLAQQLALSGQKPQDTKCTDPGNYLIGYKFSMSLNEYKVIASCSGGDVTNPAKIAKDVVLPTGITEIVAPAGDIMFKVLGQGTDITPGGQKVITLKQANTTNEFKVTVGSGGEIQ